MTELAVVYRDAAAEGEFSVTQSHRKDTPDCNSFYLCYDFLERLRRVVGFVYWPSDDDVVRAHFYCVCRRGYSFLVSLSNGYVALASYFAALGSYFFYQYMYKRRKREEALASASPSLVTE